MDITSTSPYHPASTAAVSLSDSGGVARITYVLFDTDLFPLRAGLRSVLICGVVDLLSFDELAIDGLGKRYTERQKIPNSSH